jgi:very-short-patch-repair endonuclease
MSLLNTICSYWYDCIISEDALLAQVDITDAQKVLLNPFDSDPFLFNTKDPTHSVTDKRLLQFIKNEHTGTDLYYGYPILYHHDPDSQKLTVSPLFLLKLSCWKNDAETFFSKDETVPSLGITALAPLGLTLEEATCINKKLVPLFCGKNKLSGKQLCTAVLKILLEEASLPAEKNIDPVAMIKTPRFQKGMTNGLYNTNALFYGESTGYNNHLIKDLLELKSRRDCEKTALRFFVKRQRIIRKRNLTPILPFHANEYQTKAIADIFQNRLTVVTGPPGTGKSQFIANLVVNLFLKGKRVLFVSHTGEAVDVVTTKVNDEFRNLMLRTGKKELRQELKGKVNDLQIMASKRITQPGNRKYIHSLWAHIQDWRNAVIKRDKMESAFQQSFFLLQELSEKHNLPRSSLLNMAHTATIKYQEHKLKKMKAALVSMPTRIKMETKIKQLEKEYYDACRIYVQSLYVEHMFPDAKATGSINTFINRISNSTSSQTGKPDLVTADTLSGLRVWSSTLKSLRATFPLKANLFDYVIFDESSQIDLPSSAPALYRSKNAVIVGDPMQLTHICDITGDKDYELAKRHKLADMGHIYPSKIRYCDVSLYKAAENCLTAKPLFLVNHYRSDHQIISLCNDVFYKGNLKIFSSLNYNAFPPTLPVGVSWQDVKGETVKHYSGSRENRKEAGVVCRLFADTLERISGTNLTIGIVTPYSRQQRLIERKIIQNTDTRLLEKHKVKILTAHQFQGAEKDIIIFSTVLAAMGNGKTDTWYNLSPQILNVALSRPRYLLYIVGDKDYCRGRQGILGKISAVYDKIKAEERKETYDLRAKFDTPAERKFYECMQQLKIEKLGYRLIPKYFVKRYVLDFALLGKRKIAVEIDGMQHETIEGIPILEDVERDAFLKNDGWTVLRFPNYMVLSDMPEIKKHVSLYLQ